MERWFYLIVLYANPNQIVVKTQSVGKGFKLAVSDMVPGTPPGQLVNAESEATQLR